MGNNPYKDEKGHWTTKENDGGPCKHESGDKDDYENDLKPAEKKKYYVGTLDGKYDDIIEATSSEEAEQIAQEKYGKYMGGDEVEVEELENEESTNNNYEKYNKLINSGDIYDFEDFKSMAYRSLGENILDSVAKKLGKNNRNELTREEFINGLSDKEFEEILNDNLDIDMDKTKNSIKENTPYKPQYDPEDFEDARFYPNKTGSSTDKNNRWIGRHYSIKEAHGLKDMFDDRVKSVGNYKGTSMYQLPDGYYSINPNITSMSFKTKEALQDYLDKKNPEEHKYGVYWDGDIQRAYRDTEDKYDMEAPDAYKAARKVNSVSQNSKQNILQDHIKQTEDFINQVTDPGVKQSLQAYLKSLKAQAIGEKYSDKIK